MESSNKWLKIIISCTVSMSAVAVFLLLYDFPKKIDIEYPAIEFRVDKPESAEATTIKIKGTVRKPLFRKPTFDGQFIVDKYDYTKWLPVRKIDLDLALVELLYAGNLNGTAFISPLGYLKHAERFSRLNILVAEGISENQKIYKDLRISAPAKNYEEAMKINEELYVQVKFGASERLATD